MRRTRAITTKWNLFFHYFTVLYAIISGIALTPLYLQSVPLNQYGAWLAVSNVIGWLSIADPGLSTALMQRTSVAFAKKDTTRLAGYIFNGTLISAATSIATLALGLTLGPFIFDILAIADENKFHALTAAFKLAVFASALTIFSYGITAINQGLQSSLGIGLIFAAANLSCIGLTITALFNGFGLLSIPYGMLLRSCVLVLGNGFYLSWRMQTDNIPLSFNTNRLRELISLLSYTFWGKALSSISINLDAIIITRYLGAEVTPVLLLSRKAPDLSRTFLERPALAFMPAISNLWGSGKKAETKAILLRLLNALLWLTGLAFTGFILLNEAFVQLWVGRSMYAGTITNILIVISLAVTVILTSLSNLCFALGNIKGNSIATLLQSLLSIPLLLLATPAFGIPGAVAAQLLSVICTSGWYHPLIFSRLLEIKRENLNGIIRETCSMALATAVSIGCLAKLTPNSWTVFTLDTIIVTFTYTGLLFASSQKFRYEIKNLSNSLRNA